MGKGPVKISQAPFHEGYYVVTPNVKALLLDAEVAVAGWIEGGPPVGLTLDSGKRYGDDLFLAGNRRIVTEDTHYYTDPQRKAPPWKS